MNKRVKYILWIGITGIVVLVLWILYGVFVLKIWS
jgi:hypothetical protein